MFAIISIIPTALIVRLTLFAQLVAALVIKHVTQVVTNAKINAPKQSRSTDAMALAAAVVFGNGLMFLPATHSVVLAVAAMVVKRIAVLNAKLAVTARTSV
jgi:uncharacterized membrane protein